MYSLSSFCCVCLHDGEKLQSLEEDDYDNIKLLTKLQFCALENEECILNNISVYICLQCCHILRLAYNFKKMCVNNNHFIRGYVSTLKTSDLINKSVEQSTSISLKNLKNYINSVKVDEEKSKSPIIEDKTSNNSSTDNEVEILDESDESLENISSLEPEIDIQENDEELKIIVEEKLPETKQKNLTQPYDKKYDKNKNELFLTHNNDFQEKSSTQTLLLLKNLVEGTNTVAVDKLKQLVSEPIPDMLTPSLNSEFFLETEQGNNFETVYVKPEPLENLQPETTEESPVSDVEGEENIASNDMIKLLVNRNDNFCPLCRKSFTCKSYYERHITMHTGVKNYQCDICKKRFTRKSTLKTHILAHTGELSFSCPVCKKLFTQKGNMKSHLATHFPNILKQQIGKLHSNESKEQCPICKRFYSKHIFLVHLASHKELRKY